MQRTNVVLDELLVAEGLELAHAKSIRDLVDRSLRELVARLKRQRILELRGSNLWEGDLGAMRKDAK
jgi:Arc/MetJ family transcription regulator